MERWTLHRCKLCGGIGVGLYCQRNRCHGVPGGMIAKPIKGEAIIVIPESSIRAGHLSDSSFTNLLHYLLARYKEQDGVGASRLECQYSFVLDDLRTGTLKDWSHAEALFDDLMNRMDG